jgi:type IV secretion system protein VirD4
MPATKILWGQIVAVLLIVLATTWGATQWTAWRLGYQPELGQPWFELMCGVPIYLPPAFFWWWYVYDAYAPHIFVEGATIAASGGFLSIVVAIAMSVWRAREARSAETYGSARWATSKEIKAAGLLGSDGVVLGRHHREYLRHDGPEHVLCFAPTRSGKGVGLVVPTLLTWPGSAIVHDIKGENWSLTTGFRVRHGRVLLFDPTEALVLFVRFWLTITPPLPPDTQAAAQVKGRERYEGFIEALARRMNQGRSLFDEIPRDMAGAEPLEPEADEAPVSG